MTSWSFVFVIKVSSVPFFEIAPRKEKILYYASPKSLHNVSPPHSALPMEHRLYTSHLSPEMQEAVQLRTSLSASFTARQTTCWSGLLMSWWNVSVHLHCYCTPTNQRVLPQAHISEYPHLRHAITFRTGALEGASFETLLTHAVNLAQMPLFSRPLK